MIRYYYYVINPNGNTEGPGEILMPEGWNDTPVQIERDTLGHGFIKSFGTGELTAYCNLFDESAGISALYYGILNNYTQYGADIDVQVWSTDDCTGAEVETRRVSLDLYEAEITDHYIKAPAQTTTIHKVIAARAKNKNDLFKSADIDGHTIPAATPMQATYRSKAILFQFAGNTKLGEATQFTRLGENNNEPIFLQVAFSSPVGYGLTPINELPGYFAYPSGMSLLNPADVLKYTVLVPVEAPGNFDINLRLQHLSVNNSVQALSGGTINKVKYYWVISVNGAETISNIFEVYPSGSPTTVSLGGLLMAVSLNVDLVPGDQVYINGYFEIGITGSNSQAETGVVVEFFEEESYLTITNNSILPDEAEAGLMVHEALNKSLELITGIEDIAYSEFYGRTDSNRVYPADGCGALLFLNNGRLKREMDETPTFQISFYEMLLEGLAPVDNVGYNLEFDNGEPRIRIEPIEYYFNNYPIFQAENITDYREEVAFDLIYNKIEIGYLDEAPDDINTIDEFNTRRELSTPVIKNDAALVKLSKLIYGGYAHEFTNRKKDKTSAYKYDNKNFALVVQRDGSGFKSEQGEQFNNISGLFSPDTVVNAVKSPMRNLTNFAPQIAAAVYRKPDSDLLRYTYGEGNTAMITNIDPGTCTNPAAGYEMEESQDWELSRIRQNGVIDVPEYIFFKCDLTQSEFDLIESHLFPEIGTGTGEKYGYISLNKGTESEPDIIRGFVWDATGITYNPGEGTAEFKLIKSYIQTDPETVDFDSVDFDSVDIN